MDYLTSEHRKIHTLVEAGKVLYERINTLELRLFEAQKTRENQLALIRTLKNKLKETQTKEK